MEYFDVVNEKDEVIGKESRDVVHRDHLIHRAVTIFVFNDKNELYMAQRSKNKKVNPLKWQAPPSGHVDSGESYEDAAHRELKEECDIEAEIVSQRDKINKRLRYIQKRKNKYVLIATGHQGEKKAMLSRMIDGDTPFRFSDGDMVIFSCTVIPTKTNIKNRIILEKKLQKKDLRIFTDIHASGHASKEDLRDLLLLTKPKHIIPSHGDTVMRDAFKKLCHEMGMKRVHIDDKTKIIIK